MGKAALLSALIRWRQPDAEEIQRQNRWLTLLFVIWCILAALIPIVIGTVVLWNVWQAVQWDNFWENTFLWSIGVPTMALIQPAVHISGYLYRGRQAKQWAIQAQRLRQAAIDADETLAPLASEQYEPLTASTFSTGPIRWGPLKRPPEEKIEWMQALSGVLLGLGCIFGLTILVEWASLSDDEKLIVAGITALCFIPGLLALLWSIQMGRDFEVRADEWHVAWKRLRWWGRTSARMDWQEARAFFTFTYHKKTWTSFSWKKLRVYVLDGQRATLAWVVPAGAEAYERDAHDPFCQLIAARTRLPLRDLSAAAEELEKQAPDGRGEWLTRKAREGDYKALNSSRTLPKPAQKPARRLALLMVTPLLALGLVAGAGWGLQVYELHQYAQMLAQIRAHKPLYHDALTRPDGDWKIQSPTSDDPDSFAFASGAYQLSGGYGMYALAPRAYGDALIEVTVRLSDGDYFKSTDIGLVLHSYDPNNGLVFMVDAYGFWFVGGLAAHDTATLSPETRAINATPGAANRLDVIMRGNEYLCYVNDQLITIYHDTQNLTAPGPAPVGIYTEAGVTTSFNDFTVYPLN